MFVHVYISLVSCLTAHDNHVRRELTAQLRGVRCKEQRSERTPTVHRAYHSPVYGPNFMSDKCLREWCRKFRDGRTDVHDEGGQGRPSLVTDDLVQHVDKVVRERRRFTISELSLDFPQVCRTVLY